MLDQTDARNPVDILGEEFLQRRRSGERITVDQFAELHPDMSDQIQRVFPAIIALEHFKASQQSSSHFGQMIDFQLGEFDQLGDFRIVRELGRGGMGVVFEAEQQTLGRRVAVKVFPRHALNNNRSLDRFHREAKMAASLHHTNIVPVFGFGEQDDLQYYVMQRIDGIPLDQIAQTRVDQASGSMKKRTRDRVSQSNPTMEVRPESNDTERDFGIATSRNTESSYAKSGTKFDLNALPKFKGRSEWHVVADIGIQVASALAYAHGQGVLHRDIKPSNLLLDPQGTVLGYRFWPGNHYRGG